jgi:hypothetical protein
MSSMIFIARLDMSHHGTRHSFKDVGVIAESMRGIHNGMKCFFNVNRSWIHRGFTSGERGGHAVSPPLPVYEYMGHENISHSTTEVWRSIIMLVERSCCRWLRQILQQKVSVAVACKAIWQNMRAYRTSTEDPCHTLMLELLSMSRLDYTTKILL